VGPSASIDVLEIRKYPSLTGIGTPDYPADSLVVILTTPPELIITLPSINAYELFLPFHLQLSLHMQAIYPL
jgi:hypothetical protein